MKLAKSARSTLDENFLNTKSLESTTGPWERAETATVDRDPSRASHDVLIYQIRTPPLDPVSAYHSSPHPMSSSRVNPVIEIL